MVDVRKSYRFNLNINGEIIPPQPMGTFIGFSFAISPALLSLLLFHKLSLNHFSPVIIQYFPNFWALQRAGFLSNNDLGLIERLTLLYLLSRAVHFLLFRRRQLAAFSISDPPPVEMWRRWPAQISGLLKGGAISMLVSLIFGPLAYFENLLSLRYAFIVFMSFEMGCAYLTEGLVSFGLRAAFRSKFGSTAPE